MKALSLLSLAVLLGIPPATPAGAGTVAGREIGHLLDAVARSSCAFIRNGTAYPAAEAKAHLERKYSYLRDRVKTAEDFIEHVASRSSTSGRPYLVRCQPGQDRQSAEWFRGELQTFRDRSR